MPFYIIKGRFQVAGTSPEGDSIHFRADDESKWSLLGVNPPVVLKGHTRTAQLCFEAIDAPEAHFHPDGSATTYHQPLEWAHRARYEMLKAVGVGSAVWGPQGTVSKADNDGARGYILCRSVDTHGRPVAFAYQGDTPEPDGQKIYLDVAHIRASVNFKLALAGLVYPAYYTGLFSELRSGFSAAFSTARQSGTGLWRHDKTNKGVDVTGLPAVTDRQMVMPRLFRRIVSYMDEGGGIEGFDDFLAARREKVLIIPSNHFTHFDNIVNIEGITVSLKMPPEDIVFFPD